MHELARQGASVGRGRISTLHRQDSMSTQDSWAADRTAAEPGQDQRATQRRHAARMTAERHFASKRKRAGEADPFETLKEALT